MQLNGLGSLVFTSCACIPTQSGATALEEAASNKSLELANILLEAGASVDSSRVSTKALGKGSLGRAARHTPTRLRMQQRLVPWPATPNRTMSCCVAHVSNVPIMLCKPGLVQLLLHIGCLCMHAGVHHQAPAPGGHHPEPSRSQGGRGPPGQGHEPQHPVAPRGDGQRLQRGAGPHNHAAGEWEGVIIYCWHMYVAFRTVHWDCPLVNGFRSLVGCTATGSALQVAFAAKQYSVMEVLLQHGADQSMTAASAGAEVRHTAAGIHNSTRRLLRPFPPPRTNRCPA